LLASEGFEVLTAKNGVEAVAVHSRHRNQISLAILDCGLATLDGWHGFSTDEKNQSEAKRYSCQRLRVHPRVGKGELSGVLRKPYLGEEILAMIKQSIKS
jgi:DNA-binding response OmpR family regulator